MKYKSGSTSLAGFGFMTMFVALLFGIIIAIVSVRGNFTFKRDYLSNWSLADKSSSIVAKGEYINKFVQSLESNRHDFAENDAIFMTTPDNSFDKNLEALISLRDRLEQIKTMDPKSFEYQTAIQQITAQEQGEAHEMISVIYGCYLLENYKLAWGWIFGLSFIVSLLLFIFGLACVAND